MARIYVSISGNIGVGKSTFARRLSRILGLVQFPEPVTNPYLADYYRDKRRWGFHSQVQFALDYSEVHRQITASSDAVCQDRNLHECHIFVRALTGAGILSCREAATVHQLIDHCLAASQKPDLLVYMKASVPTLLRRIQQRGLGSERVIDAEYLARLQAGYDEWIAGLAICPILSIDADRYDLDNREHLHSFCTQIGQAIGLRHDG